MSFKACAYMFFVLAPCLCLAQQDEEALIQEVIEFISEQREEEQDYSELSERLQVYRRRPLNINRASESDLRELMFISAIQIRNLMDHIRLNGPLQDILELQSIEGFDEQIVRWMMNFVAVVPPGALDEQSAGKWIGEGNHDLMIRFGRTLERQAGYLLRDAGPAAYSGSPDRLFTRYRFNYRNRVSAAFNMEKDAGEAFLAGSGRGFDFYSGNISFKGERLLQKLVVGDYALQFGQGLSMWTGLSFGKGAGIYTAARQAIGLRPYSSVNENSFMRGVSATLGYKRLSFTPFFSYRKLDAAVSADGKEISSLPESGLHRTGSELENKNRVSQLVWGLTSAYTVRNLNVGITAYRTRLGLPLAAGTSLYEQFNFAAQSLDNVGLHYSYSLKNTYFFGEAAHSLSSGSAFFSGLMSSLSSRVSLALSVRDYDRNYHSFFNQGFAESTDARNERGFYTGLWLKFSRRIELYSYADVFKFPWLRYRVDAPSRGYELFSQITYSFDKKFKLTGRFRRQLKEENASASIGSAGLEPVMKQNYRIELSYKAGNSFTLRNRAEMVSYKKGPGRNEYGFLNYQEVVFNPMSSKFSGNIRFALFDTPSFNSRIYAYENDVLYGYSVPAFQGSGLRWYINGRYTLMRGLDIWLRYAQTSYANQETVSSGNDLIAGNRRSDVRMQLRMQF